MGVKCVYCGSRRTKPIADLGDGAYRYVCLDCGKIFFVQRIYNEQGKLIKTIKLKAIKFPIQAGPFIFTKEDVEREFNNYLAMFRAFGIQVPIIFDDEYLYYFGDLTIKYDGYFVGLYASGIRVARKKVGDITKVD